MQSGDHQLHHHHHQNHGGHPEELAQIDPDRPANEAHAKQHGKRNPRQRADPLQHSGSIEPYRRQQQNRLHAFPENHQEDEEENSPSGPRAALLYLQPSFNLALQLAPVAVHPDHHAEHKKRAEQQRVTAVSVLIEAQSRKAPGSHKASNYST